MLELHRLYHFESPTDGEFAALVVALDPAITREEQSSLSLALVEQGCRYAVCAGINASSWDDSVDMAFLGSDTDFNPPDARFVMTSWHDDEPPEDVVHFFANCTTFDNFEANQFVAVFLGAAPDPAYLASLRNAFTGT